MSKRRCKQMGIRAKRTPRMIRAWKKAWRKYGNGQQGEPYVPLWRIVHYFGNIDGKKTSKRMARDLAWIKYGSDTTAPGAWKHDMNSYWRSHPVVY